MLQLCKDHSGTRESRGVGSTAAAHGRGGYEAASQPRAETALQA